LIVIPKEDGTRKTEYGIFLNNNGKGIGFEHVVHYDKGITSDHVIASGSFPVNFDFAKIEVESYGITHDDRSTNLETAPSNNGNNYSYTKEMRYFWDGGLMSNTPLMQLVLLHRDYWWKVKGLKDTVPRLGICVINLHPKKQEEIPKDRDGVINRNNDITFSDRVYQEEAMLLLVSDCIDLVRSLIKVTKEHGIEKNVIKSLLDQKTRFHGKFIKLGRFLDIVEGRFQIDDIIQVNRKNDEHTISNKIFDFSLETINLLFEERYNDAHNGFKEYIESKNKEQLTV